MMVSARYNMLVHVIYSSYVMLISMHVVGPVQYCYYMSVFDLQDWLDHVQTRALTCENELEFHCIWHSNEVCELGVQILQQIFNWQKKRWCSIKTSPVLWLQTLTEVLTLLVKDLDTLSLVGGVCQSSTDPREGFGTLTERQTDQKYSITCTRC